MRSEDVIAIGRFARRKGEGKGDKSKSVTDRLFTAAVCIATTLCLGLSFGALVHAQFDCLAWVPVSLLPWLLIVVFHRLSRSAYGLDKTSRRTVNELLRRTASGEFGNPKLGNGALAWFTTRGVFAQSGHFYPWKRLSAVVVEPVRHDDGHTIYAARFSVSRSHTTETFLWKSVVLPASIAAVGIVLFCQVRVISAGASALGWRDDVLALLFATVLEVVLLISLTMRAFSEYKRLAAEAEWTININGSISDDAIRLLTDRHCLPDRPDQHDDYRL